MKSRLHICTPERNINQNELLAKPETHDIEKYQMHSNRPTVHMGEI
jgi:hypothetical protein